MTTSMNLKGVLTDSQIFPPASLHAVEIESGQRLLQFDGVACSLWTVDLPRFTVFLR